MSSEMTGLVDAQGRLFGRWNLIDIGVVTVIVTLSYGLFVAAQVISGKVRRKPPATAEVISPVSVRVEVMLGELDEERIKPIREGDTERDQEGKEIATILHVGKPQPQVLSLVFGQQMVEASYPTLSQLPVEIRLVGEARGATYFFQGRMIGKGSRIAFRTPHYHVTGTVINPLSLTPEPVINEPVINEGLVQSILRVKLLLKEVPAGGVAAISIQDMSKQGANGPVTARIIAYARDVSRRVFEGSILVTTDVWCTEVAQGCDDQLLEQVKMGQLLSLEFPRYRLAGEVVSVELFRK